MNQLLAKICTLFFFVLFFTACPKVDDDDIVIVEEEPLVYYFERGGHDNVANTGQICRNLIIQDFEILVRSLAETGASPIAFEDLYKYYDNGGVTIDDAILTNVDMPLVYTTIKSISAIRDLKGRVYGSYAAGIHAGMESWCSTIAENSNNASKLGSYKVFIEEETGYDVLQMFKLTAMGGVMWTHGLNNYFRFVEEDNNDTIVTFPGVDWLDYTWMEHHLDEAFGYYGAARNFHDFTDEELIAYEVDNYKDNMVVDGQIDFKTEYNFLFARLAAERDLASQTHTDFSTAIFDAFYEARVAIVDKDYDKLIDRKAIILDNWEKVVASTAVHHLNGVLKEMAILQEDATASPEMFYLHWSAMFKYTEMLRYNYENRFLQYPEVLSSKYVNAEVTYPKAIIDDIDKAVAYKNVLLEVREMFKTVYAFDEEDLAVW